MPLQDKFPAAEGYVALTNPCRFANTVTCPSGRQLGDTVQQAATCALTVQVHGHHRKLLDALSLFATETAMGAAAVRAACRALLYIPSPTTASW